MPAPERARMTELWLSWAKRSQADEPGAAGGGAVEDAGRGRQLGGGEGEAGGERVGVERPALAEGVDPERQGGRPALQGPPGSGSGVEEHRRAQGPHPGALCLQGLLVCGMDGEDEADPEQLLLAPGEACGELPGVFGGDLDVGIGEPPLGRIRAPARLQAGELAPEALGGHLGGDRLYVHGDVEPAGVGTQRLQPAAPDLSGVAGDGEAAAPAVPDPKRPGVDLDRVGSERRRRLGGRAGDAGEQLAHRVAPVCVPLPAGSGGVRRRARVTGSSTPADEPARPPGRGGPAGSRQRPRTLLAATPSRTREADPCRTERSHRFGGPAQETPGSMSVGAGLARRLAEHDEHLSAKQVPAGGEAGQERGVVARCPLQCDVREAWCGVQERVDGGADVESLGPHEYLDGFGERAQEAGEPCHQGLLLGGGAQAEDDRARPADHRQAVGPEVEHAAGADAGEREAQRCGQRRRMGPGRLGEKCLVRAGRRRVRGRAGGASGAAATPASTQRSAGTPSMRPRARSAATAATGMAAAP